MLDVIGDGGGPSKAVADRGKGKVFACEDYISSIGQIDEQEHGTLAIMTGIMRVVNIK